MSTEKEALREKKRELLKLSKKEIEKQCVDKKISISGKKMDMIDRLLNTPYVEPSVHDVSRTALKLLLCGYMRESKSMKKAQLPDVFSALCMKYYEQPLHILILSNQDLQLSLLDTATKDWRLTSNNVSDAYDCKEFGPKKKVVTCHKSHKSHNGKYNAIFKVGGGNSCRDTDCGVLLYPSDIRPNHFDTFYYKLPELPWRLSQKMDVICSNKYGLIYLASNTPESNNAFGNIYSLAIDYDDMDKSFSWKWKTEKLPKALRFVYHNSGNYCLINNNETEIFIVNGSSKNGGNLITQTSVYNMETKEYTLLANNPKSNVMCGITYHHNSNKVYIGGGQDRGSSVYYFDMHKNEYITDTFFYPKSLHQNPKLYLNEQGSILHIASFGDHISHEWIDLRANQDWKCDWSRNKSIRNFKLWANPDFLSFVDFQ